MNRKQFFYNDWRSDDEEPEREDTGTQLDHRGRKNGDEAADH